MNTKDIESDIKERGGFSDSRYHEKHGEWSSVIALPGSKDIVWGFGPTRDDSLRSAFNSLPKRGNLLGS